MWNPPNKDSRNSPEFRVVKQVAYAQPVANSQVFYPQQNVGYPFLVNNGRAKVRREHNSECVLYDPAESVVIDYVDGASAAPRLRSRGQQQPQPPLPSKKCVHQKKPVALASELGSSSEVSLGQQIHHHHHSHRVHHHHHHHRQVPTVYMPGGHVDVHYLQNQHQQPPSSRGSHSSDTSSAYSGSDTMQSLHSNGCETDPIDLEGLHESVVDSDEDLADSMDSLHVRDIVRDSLEKDPGERNPEDIEILLEFTQKLEAFNHMTMAVRRALCSVMVFAVVEKAGTTVMMDGEELDSWSVIINGEVRIDNPHSKMAPPRFLRCGDSFGITPTMQKLYHQGIMKTIQDDCQFVCITQSDYYKILNDGESNQKRIEEDGQVVLVSEFDANLKNGFKVIRGTPEKLMSQLVDENFAIDPNFDEDFLLTYRTYLPSIKVIEFLLTLMKEGRCMDRATRVLLLWVHNHFLDFETDPHMMDKLEEFEGLLEHNEKSGQLRMLNFACAEKAKPRTVTLTRPFRDEPLQFSLMGGHERGFGIFIDKVERNTKASEIGLKRGDQLLEVNRRSFEHNMTLQRAITLLMENTHLEMIVKSNLLVFKEMLQTPESVKSKRKTSDQITGMKGSDQSHQHSLKTAETLKPRPSGVPALTGKDRFKARMRALIGGNSKSSHHASETGEVNNFLSVNEDGFETGAAECPEHALKIYKSDQQYRYLLVHQETRAQEVVMLSLQEFGITELSSNYSLCEVTVKNGNVMQKRQPDNQTNLAERIGLSSRYYIKNIMSSDQLITDDAKAELSKESDVNLLDLNPMETAAQIMVEDFQTFRQIEMTEYIDNLFELVTPYGTPNLSKFGDLVNHEMMWVITEIVSETNVGKRVKIMKQLIKIAHHCYKDTQNYNSMFAITSGLNHASVRRLKNTWDKVPAKYNKLLDDMTNVMDPSMNFRRYRNLISNATPPMIPIYPMVSKDLTFIHLGNETRVENLINFEKLRMLAKEIRGLMNMCSANLDIFTLMEARGQQEYSQAMKSMNNLTTMKRNTVKHHQHGSQKHNTGMLNPKKMHEEAQMVRRVKAYLSQRTVIKNEDDLMQLSLKCEADKAMTTHTSTTSIQQHARDPHQPVRRMPSPSPSNGSTTSSTSLISEGRKSTTSGGNSQAKKFGTDSPQAVRKLMSLSEPGKTRQRRAKHSVSSLHSINSPPSSPPPVNAKKTKGHERSQSDCSVTQPVSLSAESSSVTSLPGRKHHIHPIGGAKSKLPPKSQVHLQHKVRMARTISREPKESSVDDDDFDFDDGQVSAV